MKSPLSYKIVLPAKMEEGKKYPVIYAMHGKGSNEDDMLGLTQELKDQFILIAVRGSLPEGFGYAHFTIKGIGNPDRASFDQSVELLQSFIQYTGETYPIDQQHQYLFGFSQGAILAMTLALTMGNQLKGIVALNGYIPGFVKDEYLIQSIEDVSIYISHGEFDPIFPLTFGQDNYEFFKARSQNVRFTSYSAGHEVSRENYEDFINWLLEDAAN
ncbi:alpha/beta hydrolase [Jeotgalibacillus soli]|uniref:Esterase n=1 Tax=Jeotgalibacillus soli TaxID=889306 RepID=A0A0C2RZG1_9BACL|nr:alpha/beta hydrolase-fold protein [Jeotgalibacillus soli]KIL47194.1 esterase [Jeotgalibacillus soli]